MHRKLPDGLLALTRSFPTRTTTRDHQSTSPLWSSSSTNTPTPPNHPGKSRCHPQDPSPATCFLHPTDSAPPLLRTSPRHRRKLENWDQLPRLPDLATSDVPNVRELRCKITIRPAGRKLGSLSRPGTKIDENCELHREG